MKQQLKISVVVPVYNAEQYLGQCLESLLEQGISKEHYEIICINDGSKDKSLSLLKEYAEKHQNIIVVDKQNEGVSSARNKGLDVAQGQFVWFVDADDWIAKNFLGGIAKLLDENCAHIPLVLTKCVDVNNGEVERYYNYEVFNRDIKFEEVKPFMTTARGHFFNRSLIEKVQLRFDSNLSYGEDLMFMREFLDSVRFENEKGRDYKILQCNEEGVYLYRLTSDSAMGQLHRNMEKVAGNILYRASISMQRYKMEDKPAWYRANYQEYVNLHMQEYMIYYLPALKKNIWRHLRELRGEGLYPSPPPKLGWTKPTNTMQRIQQYAFRYRALYLLYYILMRRRFKKAGVI